MLFIDDCQSDSEDLLVIIKKLDTFIDECSRKNLNQYAIRERLHREGYPVLGSGFFSHVYAYTNDYALKVCTTRNIDACRTYYDLCVGSNSPYFPKIHYIRDALDIDMYFVLMPIYKKQHYDGISQCYGAATSINPDVYTLIDQADYVLRNGTRQSAKRNIYHNLRTMMIDELHDADKVDMILYTNRHLLKALYQINCFMQVNAPAEWTFDLHGQNVMFDDQHHPIITDPVA